MKEKTLLLILIILISAFMVLCSDVEATAATSTETLATHGNWWDKFGKPKYGGTIVHRTADTLTHVGIDPAVPRGGSNQRFWNETLFIPDWALDRSIFSFSTQYVKGYSGENIALRCIISNIWIDK